MRPRPGEDHVKQVEDFRNRVFSGADLLGIMDWIGVGVGSTMHIVQEIEFEQDRPSRTLRHWTFDRDLTTERVIAMLAVQNA